MRSCPALDTDSTLDLWPHYDGGAANDSDCARSFEQLIVGDERTTSLDRLGEPLGLEVASARWKIRRKEVQCARAYLPGLLDVGAE